MAMDAEGETEKGDRDEVGKGWVRDNASSLNEDLG